MAARLLSVKYVFIDNETAGLEMMYQGKRDSANSVQHSIALSIKARALRPSPEMI
jgi:hypothetical protein